MVDRRITLAVVAGFIAFLGGCVPRIAVPPPPEIEQLGPAEFPSEYYRRLQLQRKPVYRVDPARSRLVIEVRRGGSLARFGHDHVVASHATAGYIAPDEGRADFWVPLDRLVVDEPALRTEAGFDTQPSPEDIAGTRRNMQEKVLETHRYPHALIAVREMGADTPQFQVEITLHGTTRSVAAAAKIGKTAEEIEVTGSMAIDQSRFGITPFSILGGAIAVQDRLNMTFRIHARRIE